MKPLTAVNQYKFVNSINYIYIAQICIHSYVYIHSYIGHSCYYTLTTISIIKHNRKESEHNRGIFGQKHFRQIFEHKHPQVNWKHAVTNK